jgi:hypothetical protein
VFGNDSPRKPDQGVRCLGQAVFSFSRKSFSWIQADILGPG